MLAIESVEVKVVYIDTVSNRLANNLSCWHMHKKYQDDFIARTVGKGVAMREIEFNETEFDFLL